MPKKARTIPTQTQPQATRQSSSMAPIHRAADGDMAELNRLLAEDPGHLNAEDGGGRTPLMYASFGGHDAVVERCWHWGRV